MTTVYQHKALLFDAMGYSLYLAFRLHFGDWPKFTIPYSYDVTHMLVTGLIMSLSISMELYNSPVLKSIDVTLLLIGKVS